MTKAYIGVKIVGAYPQTKDGVDGYAVIYPDNYVSWSPKHVFEAAYREVSGGEGRIVNAYHGERLCESPAGDETSVA